MKKKLALGLTWALACFSILMMSIAAYVIIDDNNQPEPVKTKIEYLAPKATVTKIYKKADIQSVTKLNSNQYTVKLKNGTTLSANQGEGNPPEAKLARVDRPLVVETDYWTTYKNSWGFTKSKRNHNIVIYTE